MIDREKVIKGLECCLPMTRRNGLGDCGKCPYDRKITLEGGITECCHELMLDALALLKAQEPRVMTREEALNSLVIEYRSGKLREVGKHVFTEGYEYYGSIWRVWDRMPTDEQREATPWN